MADTSEVSHGLEAQTAFDFRGDLDGAAFLGTARAIRDTNEGGPQVAQLLDRVEDGLDRGVGLGREDLERKGQARLFVQFRKFHDDSESIWPHGCRQKYRGQFRPEETARQLRAKKA
jgi:hypothetical protein